MERSAVGRRRRRRGCAVTGSVARALRPFVARHPQLDGPNLERIVTAVRRQTDRSSHMNKHAKRARAVAALIAYLGGPFAVDGGVAVALRGDFRLTDDSVLPFDEHDVTYMLPPDVYARRGAEYPHSRPFLRIIRWMRDQWRLCGTNRPVDLRLFLQHLWSLGVLYARKDADDGRRRRNCTVHTMYACSVRLLVRFLFSLRSGGGEAGGGARLVDDVTPLFSFVDESFVDACAPELTRQEVETLFLHDPKTFEALVGSLEIKPRGDDLTVHDGNEAWFLLRAVTSDAAALTLLQAVVLVHVDRRDRIVACVDAALATLRGSSPLAQPAAPPADVWALVDDRALILAVHLGSTPEVAMEHLQHVLRTGNDDLCGVLRDVAARLVDLVAALRRGVRESFRVEVFGAVVGVLVDHALRRPHVAAAWAQLDGAVSIEVLVRYALRLLLGCPGRPVGFDAYEAADGGPASVARVRDEWAATSPPWPGDAAAIDILAPILGVRRTFADPATAVAPLFVAERGRVATELPLDLAADTVHAVAAYTCQIGVARTVVLPAAITALLKTLALSYLACHRRHGTPHVAGAVALTTDHLASVTVQDVCCFRHCCAYAIVGDDYAPGGDQMIARSQAAVDAVVRALVDCGAVVPVADDADGAAP